jgi:hypothetical protein
VLNGAGFKPQALNRNIMEKRPRLMSGPPQQFTNKVDSTADRVADAFLHMAGLGRAGELLGG